MALEYQQRLNIGVFSLPQVQTQSCRTQIFGDPQLYVQVLKFPFQLRGNRRSWRSLPYGGRAVTQKMKSQGGGNVTPLE